MYINARMQSGNSTIECPLLDAHGIQLFGLFDVIEQGQMAACIFIETILQVNAAPDAVGGWATIAGVSFGIQRQIDVFTAVLVII